MSEPHPRTLLIRADASAQIGTGHVMRCLALAQAWQDAGGAALFAAASMPPTLAERLKQEGMSLAPLEVQAGGVEDARQTAALAQELNAAWVVVDGYDFGSTYQQTIKATGLHVLSIDDWGHAGHYCADLVLNQNLHADEPLYRNREGYTHLLLGPRYAMLRREFGAWREWQREAPVVACRVLVTLGGSDPDNQTLKVIRALQRAEIDGVEAIVVVGAASPHLQQLESTANRSPVPVRLVCNSSNMPELMAWADIAISAGGSTCWELALLGTPSLLLVLADNQEPIARRLGDLGAADNLGRSTSLSSSDIASALARLAVARSKRADMARRGQEIVDGMGAARVVRRMHAYGLRLRPAQPEDCRLLWEWANDPQTRAASFSSGQIPWERHVEWFTARLADPNSLLWIAYDATDVPVGQVRFQTQGREAVASVSMAPGERGKGYASHLITLGAQAVFAGTPVDIIHAYIKLENAASVQAFTGAGFADDGELGVQDFPVHHFVLHREKHDE